MLIRPAAASDVPAIAAIFLAARRGAVPTLPVLHADAEVLRWLERRVLPESLVLLSIDGDGAVAGFASVREDRLDHLYVDPAAQGSGHGGALLDAAKRANPGGLVLHVFQRNARARAFYERRGFRLVALRDGSANEEGEPDAVYAWRP